ncbi:hypothetical protein M430DRAFT_195301 [Amorphotheca resinae ATCC 22711]|uniref:Uncharacterized protein n=1 Tax=Amorphotheca resinae ATCC 22711 TaxID=857342 RepID=A0A2T3AP75_AMORE|nr:hypothetical protein M430DRAFT_195301 [Amorphotheca resinae ATCC 22711]PSS06731.1 hypothetical protein M430DRAFT_195301 [Amorphotheca resinae ATCC 22711]
MALCLSKGGWLPENDDENVGTTPDDVALTPTMPAVTIQTDNAGLVLANWVKKTIKESDEVKATLMTSEDKVIRAYGWHIHQQTQDRDLVEAMGVFIKRSPNRFRVADYVAASSAASSAVRKPSAVRRPSSIWPSGTVCSSAAIRLLRIPVGRRDHGIWLRVTV